MPPVVSQLQQQYLDDRGRLVSHVPMLLWTAGLCYVNVELSLGVVLATCMISVQVTTSCDITSALTALRCHCYAVGHPAAAAPKPYHS